MSEKGAQRRQRRSVVANRRRGEVVAHIDGEPRILCLTLGALAELEAAFNVSNLSDLGDYFSQGKFSSEDLVHIIGAGLRGGGNLYADEDVRCMSLDGGALGFAQVAADLLTATFNPNPDKGNPDEIRPDEISSPSLNPT